MLEPHVDLVRPALAVLAMRDVDGPVAPAGWRNVAAGAGVAATGDRRSSGHLRWRRENGTLQVETVTGDPCSGTPNR